MEIFLSFLISPYNQLACILFLAVTGTRKAFVQVKNYLSTIEWFPTVGSLFPCPLS